MTLAEATILIVDDEPILRLTFRMLLEQQGATVHVAADGAEALQVLQTARPDVMLTDKQMPVMDGMTLLRRMAAMGLCVPSILFISGVDPEDEAELQRLHVVRTATKPIHPEQLTQLMTSVLQDLPVVC